jgi:hypothetical protein
LLSEKEAARLIASPALNLADSFWFGFVDWQDATDGHGPVPGQLFDDNGINVIRQAKRLRSSLKREWIALEEYGRLYRQY